MNKAEELIMQMEVKDYLNEFTVQIATGMKKTFPIIKEVNVAININYTTLEKVP